MEFKVRASLYRKPDSRDLQPGGMIKISKVLMLSPNEFKNLQCCPLGDRAWIEANDEFMGFDPEINGSICILAITEGEDFGILINSEGYPYARYACVLPNITPEMIAAAEKVE